MLKQVGARLLAHEAGERQPIRLNGHLFQTAGSGRSASLPVQCSVDPLELPQQSGPLFAGLDECADGSVLFIDVIGEAS
jgi:hypothetical protein